MISSSRGTSVSKSELWLAKRGQLSIRQWELSDAEVLSTLVGDNLEHLRPWMPWIENEPLTLIERRSLISLWRSGYRRDGDLFAGVFLATKCVGSAGLHKRLGVGVLEIGYWIDRGHCGRGFATTAVGLLCDVAFSKSETASVEIHHDQANVISARVARAALFKFLGTGPHEITAPAEIGVEWSWEMTRSAWESNKHAS